MHRWQRGMQPVGPPLFGNDDCRGDADDRSNRQHHTGDNLPIVIVHGRNYFFFGAGFTPASVNALSRIRLSPTSRALVSNHSCSVCAPPPAPPAPIATASFPID